MSDNDLLCDVLRSLPQAKSQQDKRMWILHLKRLILENHPAKIPAKVRATCLVTAPSLCADGVNTDFEWGVLKLLPPLYHFFTQSYLSKSIYLLLDMHDKDDDCISLTGFL